MVGGACPKHPTIGMRSDGWGNIRTHTHACALTYARIHAHMHTRTKLNLSDSNVMHFIFLASVHSNMQTEMEGY